MDSFGVHSGGAAKVEIWTNMPTSFGRGTLFNTGKRKSTREPAERGTIPEVYPTMFSRALCKALALCLKPEL
eukprot:9183526-Pyramimonas_sp.AAC.1